MKTFFVFILVACIAYICAYDTSWHVIQGPEQSVNVTFDRYVYPNDDPKGEDLEVAVNLLYFNNGQDALVSYRYDLLVRDIDGDPVSKSDRNAAFKQMEEEKLEDIKKELQANSTS